MNPRQGAQGVGRGHQDPGQRGLEKQDSNPKSAGGKAKAKTDQKEQIKAIDAVLEVIQQNGLTSEDLDARQDIVQRLQKRINMSTTAEKGY
nr:hypothetical protein BaRGS_024815 [Batillaria attramentaria]